MSEMPPIAILCGGLGSRLKPLTEVLPKSLVEVCGKPFIFHQLNLIRKNGIRNVVICAGHQGVQILNYVGDGSRFGLNVSYSFDGEALLGTGGAIKKALHLLGDEFMVIYGDSYLDVPFAPIVNRFRSGNALALMTAYRGSGTNVENNIDIENGLVVGYCKSKINGLDLRYIDYGLSIFTSKAFSFLPDEMVFDLGKLASILISNRSVLGYEVNQRFYEIGSFEGLKQTERLLIT